MDGDGQSFKRMLKKLFKADSKVTQEDILMMVDEGEEEGVLAGSQKQMINNIFEFGDMNAEDIMTHRLDVVAVEKNQGVLDVVRIAQDEGFSRIPVYEESLDNIIGIIYVKDLLCLVGKSDIESIPLSNFIHEALYVPESTKCWELFTLFTTRKEHMAVVVDEYGGTSGIVTLENVLESIVGSIQDEYDDEEDDVFLIEGGGYSIDGAIRIDGLNDVFATGIEECEDYDTLGGFFVSRLGRIPEEDENASVEYNGYKYTVTEMDGKHVARIEAVQLTNDDDQ